MLIKSDGMCVKSGVACQYVRQLKVVCLLRVVCVLRVVWPVSMRVN